MTARSDLSAQQQAHVAFMRFGLGPRPPSAHELYDRIWSEQNLAYNICRNEIKRGAVLTDPRLLKDLLSSEESSPFYNGRPPCFYNGTLERRVLLQQRVRPTIGFAERLVLFWMNHFNISSNSTATNGVGALEREVIRRNLFGSFEDLLVAISQERLMLGYLDGRSSTAAKPIQNFAREILELHTVGSSSDYWSRDVDLKKNYSQADVEALTYILTGWSVKHSASDNKYLVASNLLVPSGSVNRSFIFNPGRHDKNSRTLLGQTFVYQSGPSGVVRGIEALRMLAQRPETGIRIAYKLLRHFVTDEPSETSVRNLAKIFTDTNGNLMKTSLALLDMDEAWVTPLDRLRQPYVWFVSALRGLGVPLEGLTHLTSEGSAAGYVTFQQHLESAFDAIGQRPWGWPTPDGYPDRSSYWMNGNALRVRTGALYNFLNVLSGKRYPVGNGRELVTYDPTVPNSENCRIKEGVGMKSASSPNAVQWTIPSAIDLMKKLFPQGVTAATASAVKELADRRDNIGALTVLFSSSEYVQA